MLNTHDGYTVGTHPEPYAQTMHGLAEPPVSMSHYDGNRWEQWETGAPAQTQTVRFLTADDMWAFIQTEELSSPVVSSSNRFPPNALITEAWRKVGADWQAVAWPFNDIIGIGPLARGTPGEYWAAALHEDPDQLAGMSWRGRPSEWSLIHFADGAWHAYTPARQ